jgi:hypothetical protein
LEADTMTVYLPRVPHSQVSSQKEGLGNVKPKNEEPGHNLSACNSVPASSTERK